MLPRAAKVRSHGASDGIGIDVNGTRFYARWTGARTTGDVSLQQVREVLLHHSDGPLVVVGRRISSGARDRLSRAGIGWVEETSSAEIAFDGLVVSRHGRNVLQPRRSWGWPRSVLALAEALLCGVRPTVLATMEATGLSAGSCAQGLSFLTRLRFLTADAARGRSSARRIVDADDLLDSYSGATGETQTDVSVPVEVVGNDMIRVLTAASRKWDLAGILWAATGSLAAQVLAPSRARLINADVFVAADTRCSIVAIAAIAGFRPTRWGRLTLRPFPTVTTRRLTDEKLGIRLAPWPRVYADLCSGGTWAKKAAENLRNREHRLTTE